MKKTIIVIIVGIVFGSIGVLGATYLYHANEVSYTPRNSNFNVDNVESAISELYEKTLPDTNLAEEIVLMNSASQYKYRFVDMKKNYYDYSSDNSYTDGTAINKSDILEFVSNSGGWTYNLSVKKAGYYYCSQSYSGIVYLNVGQTISINGSSTFMCIYFGDIFKKSDNKISTEIVRFGSPSQYKYFVEDIKPRYYNYNIDDYLTGTTINKSDILEYDSNSGGWIYNFKVKKAGYYYCSSHTIALDTGIVYKNVNDTISKVNGSVPAYFIYFGETNPTA